MAPLAIIDLFDEARRMGRIDGYRPRWDAVTCARHVIASLAKAVLSGQIVGTSNIAERGSLGAREFQPLKDLAEVGC